MILASGYVHKSLYQESTLLSPENVTHYLASVLIIGSVLYSLLQIQGNYSAKAVQLWLDLKVDWSKDTLCLAKLENDL